MIEKSLITLKRPQSIIAEQYSNIRTNIEFSMYEHNAKTIVVTSPTAGEGKSTMITNLAFSLAQEGKKVLIIDSNVRHPSIHHYFKMKNVVGLTNVLVGQKPLSEAITITEHNIAVITSGPIPANSTQLFASSVMIELLDAVKEQFDVVLLDSAPVLEGMDTKTFAGRCDGVILVVSRGKTENDEAIEAKQILDVAKANVMGIVLNAKTNSFLKRRHRGFFQV